MNRIASSQVFDILVIGLFWLLCLALFVDALLEPVCSLAKVKSIA